MADREGTDRVATALAPLAPLATLALLLVTALALRELASLVVPILFGLFLALIAWPLVPTLERRGLGHGPALVATGGLVLLVVLVGTGVLVLSVAELVILVPAYEDRLAEVIERIRTTLAAFGIAADPEVLAGAISPGTLASFAQAAAGAASRAAAAVLVLAITLVYALAGARSLLERAESALGDRHALLAGVERFGVDLRRYLLVRAQLGVFAAVLAFVLLAFIGVPLPALWAILLFAASFIPNVGTLLALVPPTILALLDGGFAAAGAVVVGIGLINVAQDYLLQPRLMATELNMSPLVVFVSIVAWAWILGPAGALLAVPLTVGLIALLEATPGGRTAALLLRDRLDEPAVLVAEPARRRTARRR